MKKFLSILACFMLTIMTGFMLVGCGAETNDFITAAENPASFSGSDVKFSNTSDFTLTYKGDNHYVAEGTANKMTADQASAWGTVENSKFVVVNVKMGEQATAILGWRTAETKGNKFENEEIDGSLIKRSTAKNPTKNYILALTDGDTPRHPDLTTWRIEVTKKGATEAEYYTIDFSALYE